MRLLLAEDEKKLARALVKILERNQYTADVVYDGESALKCLDTGNYDAESESAGPVSEGGKYNA